MDIYQLKKIRIPEKRACSAFYTVFCALCRKKLQLQPHTGHSENNNVTNMRGGPEKQNEMVNLQESYFLFPYALLLNNKILL